MIENRTVSVRIVDRVFGRSKNIDYGLQIGKSVRRYQPSYALRARQGELEADHPAHTVTNQIDRPQSKEVQSLVEVREQIIQGNQFGTVLRTTMVSEV